VLWQAEQHGTDLLEVPAFPNFGLSKPPRVDEAGGTQQQHVPSAVAGQEQLLPIDRKAEKNHRELIRLADDSIRLIGGLAGGHQAR
jgi:hypothetical protein